MIEDLISEPDIDTTCERTMLANDFPQYAYDAISADLSNSFT